MGRYFFHVTNGSTAFADDLGTVCPDADDARARARVIGAELAREAQHYQGFTIQVTDERGNEIARIPVQSH
jgi:hypothetical protein